MINYNYYLLIIVQFDILNCFFIICQFHVLPANSGTSIILLMVVLQFRSFVGVVNYPWTPHCGLNRIFNNAYGKTFISLQLLTVLEYTCSLSSFLNTMNGKMFKTRIRHTINPTTTMVLANTAVDTVSRAAA